MSLSCTECRETLSLGQRPQNLEELKYRDGLSGPQWTVGFDCIWTKSELLGALFQCQVLPSNMPLAPPKILSHSCSPICQSLWSWNGAVVTVTHGYSGAPPARWPLMSLHGQKSSYFLCMKWRRGQTALKHIPDYVVYHLTLQVSCCWRIWLLCSTCSVDRFSSSLLLITAKLGFPVEW